MTPGRRRISASDARGNIGVFACDGVTSSAIFFVSGLTSATIAADPRLIPAAASHGTVRASASRSDRKSTRLNSSHVAISYAVSYLKKKNGGTYAYWLASSTGLIDEVLRA